MKNVKKLLKRIIYKLFVEHSALQGYVAHIPHGMLNVFLAVYFHWTIALLFGIGYIVFQYWQKYQGHPIDPDDLTGWMLGMGIAGVLYYIFG